jgi:hypothetical protein
MKTTGSLFPFAPFLYLAPCAFCPFFKKNKKIGMLSSREKKKKGVKRHE